MPDLFSHYTIHRDQGEIVKYLFPNHQIHITNVFDGHYDGMNLSNQDLHTHDFYVLIWVECGNIEYTLDVDKYDIGSHTLLFVAPNDIHSYHSGGAIDGVSVFFTDNFFSSIPENWSRFLKYNVLQNLPFLQFKRKESILRIKSSLEKLQEEFLLFSEHRINYIGVYTALISLLYGVSETEEFLNISPKIGSAQRKSLDLYFAFLEKLEIQYTQFHSVQHYADELGVSVSRLEVSCKECSGETARNIIQNRIVQEAKRLLIHSLKRSGEIAFLLGFKEQAHFINHFKKHTQMTPTQFRRKFGIRL